MKRRVFLSILGIFGCLCLFAQTSNNPQKVPTTKELSNTVKSLTEKTEQLSSDNQALTKEIEELSGQIKKLKEDVEIYRGDVRNGISNYYDRLNNWLVIISIVFASFGLVAPYLINKNYEEKFNKSLERLQTRLDEVSNKALEAQEAKTTSEGLKQQIDGIKATVENMSKEAEESANNARMSQLFSEAVSETDLQKQIDLFTEYIRLDPKSANAYYNRGNAKADLKNFEDAINDYSIAIELDPTNASAYYNRGNAKADLMNFEGAINDYNKAIELDPGKANAHCNRGNMRFRLNDFEGAITDYSKAIELNTNYKLAYKNRAVTYKKLEAETVDKGKKKEYLDKAKADEEKAKSLEKQNNLPEMTRK